MPRVTRSSEVLNLVEGLFFINDKVIDVAAKLYNELKSVSSTYGEEAIERLVPNVITLMSSLDDYSREVHDQKKSIEELQESLVLAEQKCSGLNSSFRSMTAEHHELSDQYTEEITNLKSELRQTRQDNADLRESLRSYQQSDVARMKIECEKRVSALNAERQCLLTTIEVLEADVRCLRAEVRRMEQRARQRRVSCSDLDVSASVTPDGGCSGLTDTAPCDEPAPPSPHHLDPATTSPGQCLGDFRNVLIIGDSLLRHASMDCVNRGAYLECCPGGKYADIRDRGMRAHRAL